MLNDYLFKKCLTTRKLYNEIKDDGEHFLIETAHGYCIENTDIQVLLQKRGEGVYNVVVVNEDVETDMGCIYLMENGKWASLYRSVSEHETAPVVHETITSGSKITVVEKLLNNIGVV